MKTAGYDIVVVLNEKFLGQISGALLYNGFLTFNGQKDFKEKLSPETISKIPDDLKSFLEVKYRVKLKYEPYIDFQENNKVGITLDLRVYLWFFEGLELKFDAMLTVNCPILIDSDNNKLSLDFVQTEIKQFDIKYNYTLDQSFRLHLNTIFEDAIKAYFTNNANKFGINLPTYKAHLPFTRDIPANKLPIEIMGIKTVGPQALAVATNLLDYKGGDITKVEEFARGSNVGVAISQMAMTKVYDFWWAHTYWDKAFHKTDSFHIDLVDDVLGVLTAITSFVIEAGFRLATLGFVETSITYLGSRFDYSLDVFFVSKPAFDLLPGNKVNIYNLGIDVFFRLKMYVTFHGELKVDTSGFIPDQCTPWEDDVIISESTKTSEIFDLCVSVKNFQVTKCIGEVILNPDNNTLTCKIIDLEVDLGEFIQVNCLYLKLPQKIKDMIYASYKQKILEKIPPIVLSPTYTADIPKIPWDLVITGRKLEITDSEAIVGANMYFEELNKNVWPVPKYIVNVNNQEIHKSGCDSINDTYETHQLGYYLLSDALEKNDGCKKCLPAFHSR